MALARSYGLALELLKKPAIYLRRRSKLLQRWKARIGICTQLRNIIRQLVNILTIRTAKRKRSSDCNS